MKTVTTYLLKFAITTTLATIIFRYFLSYGAEHKLSLLITLSSMLYGIIMFLLGMYYGRKEGKYLPISDAGFRFHLTSYLVYNSVSELWFILGFNNSNESIKEVHYTAMYWGIFVIMHFIFYIRAKRKSISGLNKSELFD